MGLSLNLKVTFSPGNADINTIIKNCKELEKKKVNVGVVKGTDAKVDGVPVIDYAAMNHQGVAKKGGGWKIPPRPFLTDYFGNKKEEIEKTEAGLVTRVANGEIDADTALNLLGRYLRSGVREYIPKGDFVPNSPATIRKKGSSTPLIDTGTLRRNINYEIVNAGEGSE